MSTNLDEIPENATITPLIWLMGRWKAVNAEGSYPTIESFKYSDEISFKYIGQPMLIYSSYSTNPKNGKPMHLESGFLKIQPGTNNIAFIVAHNFGVTSIEEGSITESSMKCVSTEISRISFAKEPAVVKITREFILKENGDLEVFVNMETSKSQLTQHLHAVYQKCT